MSWLESQMRIYRGQFTLNPTAMIRIAHLEVYLKSQLNN